VYDLVAVAALLTQIGCAASEPKTPARIVGGLRDTVVINERQPARIRVRVFDVSGKSLPDTGVQFVALDGNNPEVSPDGVVHCLHSSDFRARASIGSISTTITVRCRPVKTVHIDGPIQFLLPDTGQDMRVSAFDLDGKPVDVMIGKTSIGDTTIATISDLRITPESPGATIAGARFGNQSAGVGVHVYERATSLDPLFGGKEYIGIPLRLPGGAFRTWQLPPGTWMLTMIPEEDNEGLALRIEGAACSPVFLTPRRLGCLVKKSATVTVYNRSASPNAPDKTGSLLVRRINS
jgi:hypothetical protein